MSYYVVEAPADDDENNTSAAAVRTAATIPPVAAQRPQLVDIEEDLRNMQEIEQAMNEQLGMDASPTEAWTEAIENSMDGFLNALDDSEPSLPDEECEDFLEQELQKMETLKTDDVAPTTMTGQLADAAAEFWFPGSRDCSCCSGYKHACKCVRLKGFVACQKEGCCTEEFLGVQKKPTTASYYTPAPAQASHSAPLPPAPAPATMSAPVRMSPRVTAPAPVSAPAPAPAPLRMSPRVTAPPSVSVAVPQNSQPVHRTGRIPSNAMEFWFPASRGCPCCEGYKHACKCVVVNGFVACQCEGCCTEEFYGVMNEFFVPYLQEQEAPESFAHSAETTVWGPEQQYGNAYYGADGAYYAAGGDYPNPQEPWTQGHHHYYGNNQK